MTGHRAIWIQEFDLAARKLIGPRKVLINGGVDFATKPVWIEGPRLYHHEGWYILMCAEGGTERAALRGCPAIPLTLGAVPALRG